MNFLKCTTYINILYDFLEYTTGSRSITGLPLHHRARIPEVGWPVGYTAGQWAAPPPDRICRRVTASQREEEDYNVII